MSGIKSTGTIDAGEGFYVGGTPISAAAVVWEQGSFAQGAPTLVVEGSGVLSGGAGLPVTLSIASGAGAEFEQGTVTAAGVITLSSDFDLSAGALALSPAGPLGISLASIGSIASAAQPKIAAAPGEILFGPSTLGGALEQVMLGAGLSLSGTTLENDGVLGLAVGASTIIGDVTLVAGSNITLSASGQNITVSSALGASSSGLYDISAGVPASLGTVAADTSAVFTQNGTKACSVNLVGSATSPSGLNGFTTPAPAGSAWRVAILYAFNGIIPASNTTYVGAFIGFTDGIKFEGMDLNLSASDGVGFAFNYEKWSSISTRNSYSATSALSALFLNPSPHWIGVRLAAGIYYIEVSSDGAIWATVYSFSPAYLSSYGTLFFGLVQFAGANAGATYWCVDPNGLSRVLGG